MTMSRVAASTYLTSQFQQTFEAAGVAYDMSGGLDPIVDQALLWLGTSYSDLPTATVDDQDTPGFIALLRYAALTRIYDAVLSFVDVQISDPNVSKSRNQFVKNLESAVARAKGDADPFIVGGSAFQGGVLTFTGTDCADENSAECYV